MHYFMYVFFNILLTPKRGFRSNEPPLPPPPFTLSPSTLFEPVLTTDDPLFICSQVLRQKTLYKLYEMSFFKITPFLPSFYMICMTWSTPYMGNSCFCPGYCTSRSTVTRGSYGSPFCPIQIRVTSK